ncbi:toll/interleukin-1 receptor domain-containing protein [Amycolatopsis sp., V23-08]|uniref:Toll/interleukin-1 receptor domain-containing protein n=1 Tax=Amycolatopsis heterodermiae TaxID=3110235 RepID=A0ABU5RL57_9PSEU|nr:toll/interleukin-1 receptor domain-containing protein [Amycolatopsis sp., V23-08]MEA5366464.1 toll/interleukin-1 receptor domain-containing protein [Amycolatopsis sp., V23-08]
MTDSPDDSRAGHAFISYVHQDRDAVAKLQKILSSAGVPVWLDKEDLWPGEDWRLKIRRAITKESLVFIACFSKNSSARDVSYQNEELNLAVEQLRRRPPGGTPWLIPVRLDDCEIPEYEIAPGRMLDSLQMVDLFGKDRENAASRLVGAVIRSLGTATPGMPITAKLDGSSEAVAQVKEMLLDPTRRIELHDLVTSIANKCRTTLSDEDQFPFTLEGTGKEITRAAVARVEQYWQVTKPVLEILAAGCTWGEASNERLWSSTVRGIANLVKPASGKTMLLNLRYFPPLVALYAAGLAAVYGQNYGALRAVTIDTKVRTDYGVDVPLLARSHIARPFENNKLLANILAIQASQPPESYPEFDALFDDLSADRIGGKYTPVSDYLHDSLHETFSFLILDPDDYTEAFDKLEVLLSALAIDLKKIPETYADGPWIGSFTWRRRYNASTAEGEMQAELKEQGARWSPLQAGLFGGSLDRATQAFDDLIERTGRHRLYQL